MFYDNNELNIQIICDKLSMMRYVQTIYNKMIK